jgi:hypothetical protein
MLTELLRGVSSESLDSQSRPLTMRMQTTFCSDSATDGDFSSGAGFSDGVRECQGLVQQWHPHTLQVRRAEAKIPHGALNNCGNFVDIRDIPKAELALIIGVPSPG